MTDASEFGEAALAACLAVLTRVTPDAGQLPTPCAEFTVTDLGEHLVRSLVLLGGIGGVELTAVPHAPLAASVATLGTAAITAWRARGTDGVVAVGRSTMPAHLAADIITLELVVHGWDLARAVDADFDPEDSLCEHLLVQAAQLITPDKRGRGFAAEVEVAPDSPPLRRLVAFTGRGW